MLWSLFRPEDQSNRSLCALWDFHTVPPGSLSHFVTPRGQVWTVFSFHLLPLFSWLPLLFSVPVPLPPAGCPFTSGASMSLAHLHCIIVRLEGDSLHFVRGTVGGASHGSGAGSQEPLSRPRLSAQFYPLCPGTGPGTSSTSRTGAFFRGGLTTNTSGFLPVPKKTQCYGL